MFGKTLVLLSLIMAPAFSSLPATAHEPASSACLGYEPTEVTLTGRLTRKTFPGRPNYESIKDGDEPETVWVLEVDKPFCVRDPKGQNDPEDQVKLVQLVVSHESYEEKQGLVGKKISVQGSLFHAITGHHHTPVLMTVSKIL